MVSTLTVTERQAALGLSAFVAMLGLAMIAAGRGDPLEVHGFLVMLAGIAGVFVVIGGYFAPEPGPERLKHYYDEPIKAGIVLSMIWALVAMFFGAGWHGNWRSPICGSTPRGRASGDCGRFTPPGSSSASAAMR